MTKKKFDFGGWATKNDLLCADGRTIRKNAFKDDDGRTVPLVYQHNHEDPTKVIGHALLENRDEGVYAYGSLNNTDIAQHVKELIRHGDVNGLSIFANKLTQRGGDVIHGTIRELSIVLAGANPGAVIEFPILEHGEESETEAYIWPGDEDGLTLGDNMKLKHSEEDEKIEETEETEETEEVVEETKAEVEEEKAEPVEETISHADEEKKEDKTKDDKTVQDVIDSMNEEQRKVLEYLVGVALEGEDADEEQEEKEVSHADTKSDGRTIKDVMDTMTDEQKKVTEFLVAQALASAEEEKEDEDEEEEKEVSHSDYEGEDIIMANVFDRTEINEQEENTLTHAQLETIARDARKIGSMRDAVLEHSAEYGIEQIDYLMPEYREVSGNGAPAFIKRDTTWVSKIMRGVHHTPFAKVKMTFADITGEQARARGYLKSHKKKEEVFALMKREVGPDTVYKKQKIDRDDAIDISEGFDKVAWLKSEMRMMLDEELARAFIIGDGRSPESEYKIKEDKIIPVFKDDPLYVVRATLVVPEGVPRAEALVDTVTYAWENYQGTGNCVALMTRREYSNLKLLKDRMGHRIYKNDSEIASALGVSDILFVPQMSDASTIRVDEVADKAYKPLVIILDLDDYNVGADKGGSVNMFEDFDIDYNQMKYLIETRCSGALTKPYSAIVIEEETEVPEDDEEP